MIALVFLVLALHAFDDPICERPGRLMDEDRCAVRNERDRP